MDGVVIEVTVAVSRPWLQARHRWETTVTIEVHVPTSAKSEGVVKQRFREFFYHRPGSGRKP